MELAKRDSKKLFIYSLVREVYMEESSGRRCFFEVKELVRLK
jgi:hypothetical protein